VNGDNGKVLYTHETKIVAGTAPFLIALVYLKPLSSGGIRGKIFSFQDT
jgi:hypothetical protein